MSRGRKVLEIWTRSVIAISFLVLESETSYAAGLVEARSPRAEIAVCTGATAEDGMNVEWVPLQFDNIAICAPLWSGAETYAPGELSRVMDSAARLLEEQPRVCWRNNVGSARSCWKTASRVPSV